jgi:uncharacterized membrane protein YeaQ/YmgE (transglycosylase-associated protein family)
MARTTAFSPTAAPMPTGGLAERFPRRSESHAFLWTLRSSTARDPTRSGRCAGGGRSGSRTLADCDRVLGGILSVIAIGFVIGALARLALPGPDPMPFWLTVLVGMVGSIVGGAIAGAVYGASHTFDTSNHTFVTLLLAVGAATVILAAYRRFVQRRPLSGPGARHFPSRGFGIERMRARLRQLGADPDRLESGRPQGVSPGQSGTITPEQAAEELARLRQDRDSGTISDEEYEQARERLRRY